MKNIFKPKSNAKMRSFNVIVNVRKKTIKFCQ